MMDKLKFSPANAKTKALKVIFPHIKGKVYSLDLPSGYTCPGAKHCKSMVKVDPISGRTTIQDGPDCQFRCFSASQEALFPLVRKARQYNFDLIKQAKTPIKIARIILDSIPHNAGIIRLHVGGDFFSKNYLLAMLDVAAQRPNIIFYAYTKSLHHLKAVLPLVGKCVNLVKGILLPNFRITASRGGRFDHLIGELGIRECVVIYSAKEAKQKRLPIDHTDEYAFRAGRSFSVLLHGTQPGNTLASRALSALKGSGSYTR